MFWSITLTLSESSEWHSHDVFELIFCRAGTGLLILDQENIELVSHRTILIASKARHRFVFRKNEAADLKIVCITPADIATHLSAAQSSFLYNLNKLERKFTDYPEKTSLPWELVEMIPDGLGNQDLGELHIAWGVIGLLLASCMRKRRDPENNLESRHLNTIRKICEWLDSQPEAPGDLNEIALRFGLSRSLLTREFRSYTNTSITEYINIRRLQKAGIILSSTGEGIAEAAFESGFSSLPNFYRRFKGMYGVSPAEFRSQFFKKVEKKV
jgi:AraC-like DNA-binding protein